MNRRRWSIVSMVLISALFGCRVENISNFTITAPGTVVNTTPLNGTIGYAVNNSIMVTFSKRMNESTITSDTFYLSGPSGLVAGSVVPSDSTAVFNPASDLAPNASYTATITTGVTDQSVNPLASDYVWSFTTGNFIDTTPPTVSSTTPANNSTNVAVSTAIMANFSEAMDSATLIASTFLVSGPSGSIGGTVTPNGAIATFTPATALASTTTYTAMITTAAKDLAGNALAGNYIWSFTTSAVPDTTPPTVINVAPADNAAEVAINSAVTVVFSEAINPATIAQATFFIVGSGGTVTGAITPGSTTSSFRPGANLASTATYTATVTTGIADLSGNALTADFIWSFTTGTAVDTTGPQWLDGDPGNGSINNPVNISFDFCFDELIDPATVNSSTFMLKEWPSGNLVAGSIIVTNNCATFNPFGDLKYSTDYYIDSPSGIADLAGNPTTWFQSSFSTGTSAMTDATSPSVVQVRPEANEVGASLGAVYAVFSEAIYPPNVNSSTFIVTGPSGAVNGTVVMTGKNAIFIPTDPLSRNTTYTAMITTGVTDLVGNALTSAYSWSFTTTNIGKMLRSSSDDSGRGIAVDAAGNTYVAGRTLGTLPGSTGSGKGFVVKYDASHVVQWTTQFGGATNIEVNGIGVNKATGDVYVTGTSQGAMDGELYAGSSDLFVMKFDTTGIWQWTRQRGSAGIDYAYSVAVDTGGNVYVAGNTYGAFDGNTNSGSSDIFLVKYDATGAWQWTRQRGTTTVDQAYGVTTYDDGLGTIFIYIVGGTSLSLDGITPPGGGDVALIAYDSNGNWQWTQLQGSSAYDIGTAITVDGNGSIYYTGYTFGSFEPGYSYVGTFADGIVTKCSVTGNIVWQKQIGTDQQEMMMGIAVDSLGNVYGAGFDETVILVKYDSNGTLQWEKQPSTWWGAAAAGVAIDTGGLISLTGATAGDLIEMTRQSMHNYFYYPSGDQDGFLMSFDSGGNKK